VPGNKNHSDPEICPKFFFTAFNRLLEYEIYTKFVQEVIYFSLPCGFNSRLLNGKQVTEKESQFVQVENKTMF